MKSAIDRFATSNMRDLILEWSSVWPCYRQSGSVAKEKRAYHIIVNDIPSILHRVIENYFGEFNTVEIKGSTGMASVAKCPWIRIFKGEEWKGVSANLGYLFSADCHRVYLNIGLQTGGDTRATLAEMKKIQAKAHLLANALERKADEIFDTPCRLKPGRIDLAIQPKDRARYYERSNVLGVEYKVADLPDNEVLINDLRRFIKLHKFIRFA